MEAGTETDRPETGFTARPVRTRPRPASFTPKQTVRWCLREERRARRRLATKTGNRNQYRRTIRLYLASFPARVAALHEASKPFPRDRETNVRVVPYARILAEASRLSMWREETEEVRLRQRPKSDGGRRIVMDFGRLRKARGIVMARAERAALSFHPSQYTIQGRAVGTSSRTSWPRLWIPTRG